MARPFRDEPRRERPTFFQKPKPAKTPLSLKGAKFATAPARDPYGDGLTRIYLDDERPAPAGFARVKTVAAFEQALKACPPAELAAVSLDWYLGAAESNGHEAARVLVEHFASAPQDFTNLEFVTCHSSDIEEAIKMVRTIVDAVRDNDMPWFIVDAGKPILRL